VKLIFRYIVQHAGAAQPILRLWLQSMTPASIPRCLSSRARTHDECSRLADAPAAGPRPDWLVGINGTRAMTASTADGAFFLTHGRPRADPDPGHVVDRPTTRSANSSARDYWEVRAICLRGRHL